MASHILVIGQCALFSKNGFQATSSTGRAMLTSEDVLCHNELNICNTWFYTSNRVKSHSNWKTRSILGSISWLNSWVVLGSSLVSSLDHPWFSLGSLVSVSLVAVGSKKCLFKLGDAFNGSVTFGPFLTPGSGCIHPTDPTTTQYDFSKRFLFVILRICRHSSPRIEPILERGTLLLLLLLVWSLGRPVNYRWRVWYSSLYW